MKFSLFQPLPRNPEIFGAAAPNCDFKESRFERKATYTRFPMCLLRILRESSDDSYTRRCCYRFFLPAGPSKISCRSDERRCKCNSLASAVFQLNLHGIFRGSTVFRLWGKLLASRLPICKRLVDSSLARDFYASAKPLCPLPALPIVFLISFVRISKDRVIRTKFLSFLGGTSDKFCLRVTLIHIHIS